MNPRHHPRQRRGKMSHFYDTIEPTVIDDELLLEAVHEQGPKEEAAKIARAEGISFKHVQSLQLNFKNILKPEGLWEFTNLKKLQLNNNVIEKIEFIDMLVNLVWLDLSFNNIQVIEGLDTLTKLEDLTLFNNSISRIENMDTLMNLEVFSIGNNDLDELENLIYLRQFPKLKALNLSNNPFCRKDRYAQYAAAVLPKLVYLDYRLVKSELRAEGREVFQNQLEYVHTSESKENAMREKSAKEAAENEYHRNAFVEDLNGPMLFDSMYANDPDGIMFKEFPTTEAMFAIYREKTTAICIQMFDFGLDAYKKRQAEVDTFFECIEQAKTENQIRAREAFNDFLTEKKAKLAQIRQMTSTRQIQKAVKSYNTKVSALWNALMDLEMNLMEQLEETTQSFDLSLHELMDIFIENIQSQMAKLRELEILNHERTMNIATETMERLVRGDPDLEDISNDLRLLCQDKDTMVGAVCTSHDIHMLTIDNKEDHMMSGIKRWAANLLEKVRRAEEVDRHRARVVHINKIIDNLKDQLENLELTHFGF